LPVGSSAVDNPLVATRWREITFGLRHFGQGIVPTPNDFGANGRPPLIPRCSTGWLLSYGDRLEHEKDSPVDPDEQRLSAWPPHPTQAIPPSIRTILYLWRMALTSDGSRTGAG